MKLKQGRYVDKDSQWVDILAVGRNQYGQVVAIYYDCGEVNRSGRMVHRARLVSELKNRKLRPITDKDYDKVTGVVGGGVAEYYRGT